MAPKRVALGIFKNTLANGRVSYTADIDLKGYPRQKKTWGTQEQAQQWYDLEVTTMKSKKAGLYVPPTGSVGSLIKQYVDHYGKLKGGWSQSKQKNLDKISADIGHVMLADCTMQTIMEYAYKCREGGRGASGTQERLCYLAKVFKVGFNRWGINTPRDAMARALGNLREEGTISGSTERTRRIEQWEIDQIKKLLSPAMQHIVDTLMVLPFRVSEMCAIKWKEVDEVNKSVQLHRKNTDKDKKTYYKTEWVHCPVVEAFRDGKWVEVDTFKLLTQGGRGEQEDYVFPIKGGNASRLFWAGHSKSGIDNIHLHDCRAHGITNMLAQGNEPMFVAEISGHKDMNVFKRHYCRLTPKQLRDIFETKVKDNQQARRAA